MLLDNTRNSFPYQDTESILERIDDGFYTLDREWRFTYVNREFERVTGCRREHVLGKSIWEMFPDTKKIATFTQYHRAVNEQVSVHFEEHYPPLKLWVLVNAYPTIDGLVVYFIDNTEKKQLHDSLYAESQNLKAIMSNTSDLIWSVDRNFDVICANPAFMERMRQVLNKRVKKVRMKDLSKPLQRIWKQYYMRAMENEAFREIKHSATRDGLVYEEISFNPIYGRGDNITGVSCISRDITSQVRYQEEIEAQNKALKDIAWLQSHQIRNHVANLLGLTSLLDEASPDPQIVEMIRRSAESMDNVLKKVARQASEIVKD
ncbi:MAG: PAS domain-containing protein [Mucilaginibacter polytrichastri]|nr:PAS domain-containing protein [Mucilaginibacter polytrichastri]